MHPLYNWPCFAVSSGGGFTCVVKEGAAKDPIENCPLSRFGTTLCSTLLYFPLLNICNNRKKFNLSVDILNLRRTFK
jgi:hypothetical protein